MTLKTKFLSATAGLAILTGAGAASAGDITVAYFLEWPMPFQYAKATGMYDEALDATINWRSFGAGTAMSAAMASGDVQISISQGVPPFVVAVSGGQDIQLVDIAVTYADNEGCVVDEMLEIDKDNAEELAGKKVAVPLGTAAHYSYLKQMEHLGVDPADMEVVNMNPPEAAAALAQGSVDVFCGWGGSLRRALEHGNALLTGAEKEEAGILVFDGISVPANYAAENAEQLATFLAVTAKANAMWNSGEHTDEMLSVIAKDAGMDLEAAKATIDTFSFPPPEELLSEKWLGGGVQAYMKGVADVFVEAGSIDAALETYDDTVNTGPLEAAKSEM